MNAYTRGTALLLGFIALAAAARPVDLTAQADDPIPTFLALPEAFPDLDARVVLMRQPGRDIVILKADDSSPETLQVALQLLARIRRENPPPVDRGELIPLMGYAPRGPGLSPSRRAQLESVIAALRERPVTRVGNLGWGQWMRYREPSH